MRNAVVREDEVDDVPRDGVDGVGSEGETVFAYLNVEAGLRKEERRFREGGREKGEGGGRGERDEQRGRKLERGGERGW